MANDPSLPNMQEPLIPGGKPPTSAYRKFFEKLARQTSLPASLQAEIAAILVRLDALEEGGADLGSILGLGSVSAVGQLGDQVVIQLEGDEEAPAATYYYGTDENGAKGFWPVPEPAPSGFLPIVTGEIDAGQPVFVYGPDGSLVYGPVA